MIYFYLIIGLLTSIFITCNQIFVLKEKITNLECAAALISIFVWPLTWIFFIEEIRKKMKEESEDEKK